MNKLKKIVILLIMINIILVTAFSFFKNVTYAVEQTIENEINNIDNNKYPGIKSMISELKNKYPNWNFKVLYTGLKWEDVIKGEHVHGRNLVAANSNSYDREWICPECGQKLYDNGNWHCASEDAIKYMMDPRNSLNASDIFQFLQLSYVDCTYEDVQSMVENYGYLNQKSLIENVIQIGKDKNINPFFIMAKIIQEQGKGTSVLVTGKSYEGTDGVTYEGYYNYLNIGAYGNGNATVITNGLKYAKDKGWDTPEKSIEGGLDTIANNYIKYGQDTMYFQKFNVSSTKYTYYTHQYMQNVLGAQSEGTILRRNLQNNGLLNGKYTFIIPLYEGMPKNVCQRPTSTSTSSRSSDEIRNNNDNTETQIDNNYEETDNSNIKINKEVQAVKTVPGMTVEELLKSVEGTEVKNSSGEVISENDSLGTGYKVGDYTIVVAGDVNGDAEIDIIDLALLKRHISKTQVLEDVYEVAGNIDRDGNEIDIIDLALLKRHISGSQKISF